MGRRAGGKMVDGHYWHPDDGPMPGSEVEVVKKRRKPKTRELPEPDDFVAVAIEWLYDGGGVPASDLKALFAWRDATAEFLATINQAA